MKHRYYLQPDGNWVKGADGRSRGLTLKELTDKKISKSKIFTSMKQRNSKKK